MGRHRHKAHETKSSRPGLRYTSRNLRTLVPKRKPRKATIGIDIGGTKSLYALLDESFEVVAEEKLRTHPRKGGLREFERSQARAIPALLGGARRRELPPR